MPFLAIAIEAFHHGFGRAFGAAATGAVSLIIRPGGGTVS
jgi:hypothetical protein